MDNEITKKVKNTNNSAKNKSSSNKKTTSSKKKSTSNKSKNTSVNKKSTSKKKVSNNNTKKTNTSKSNTSAVKNTNQPVKKNNTTKKKNNTKKSNTYQYNKRNLEKKKTEVKKIEVVIEELVDESLNNDLIKDKVVINQEKFIFDDENKLDNIELEHKSTEEVELLNTSEISKEELLNEVLTEKEKNSIFEEEIIEDILEDKETLYDFYPFDEEEIELESEVSNEDSLFKTLRMDLYDVYDRDNDLDEDIISTKTIESVDDKFLLVDNILTEETRRNIVPDNEFIKENNEDNEYYNVVLWDSIIGLLIVVFTTLVIFAIWFVVYLTTY